MSSKPDFICIGAQKAGTRWLYDQAASHPDIWMPPVKELRVFGDDHAFRKTQVQARTRLDKSLNRVGRGRPAGGTAAEFLRRFVNAEARDLPSRIAFYRDLFSFIEGKVSGDITPAYATLPQDQVREIARAFPDTRIIYLIREPISRLWSQASMNIRHERTDATLAEDLAAFRKYCDDGVVRAHSFQSEPIRIWRAEAGEDRFRVFVMDDLIAEPVVHRRAVFAFLGLDGDRCSLSADYNRKGGRSNFKMPAEFRPFLLEYFGDEYEKLASLVGGATLAWRRP